MTDERKGSFHDLVHRVDRYFPPRREGACVFFGKHRTAKGRLDAEEDEG